jgi:hypothetical protein
MNSRSHFQRGSGHYKCEGCGRGTRNTGKQPGESRLCPECDDLAMEENSIHDGESTIETSAALRDRTVAEIVAKGGSAEMVRREFPTLWGE